MFNLSNCLSSLCLHESLPRKSQRGSPGSSAKSTSAAATPKTQEEEQMEEVEKESTKNKETSEIQETSEEDPLLVNRHYETIEESKASNSNAIISVNDTASTGVVSATAQPMTNPTVAAVKSTEISSVQRPKNPLTLVSDANSTSSGASDMSDYIETLSSCSRGSTDTVTSIPVHSNTIASSSNNISVSPRKSSNMKPRSGKEYFKIDRSMFKNK